MLVLAVDVFKMDIYVSRAMRNLQITQPQLNSHQPIYTMHLIVLKRSVIMHHRLGNQYLPEAPYMVTIHLIRGSHHHRTSRSCDSTSMPWLILFNIIHFHILN